MIECEGLTKRFGHFTAVDHVSFKVAKSSIFGFLGPNGSGKSTVIRMLCGLLEPSEGTGRIAGFDIVRELDQIKALIGYMSQKFSLYDELTVYENLMFYGRLYGLSGAALVKRRDELVALTHIEPYLERRAALPYILSKKYGPNQNDQYRALDVPAFFQNHTALQMARILPMPRTMTSPPKARKHSAKPRQTSRA